MQRASPAGPLPLAGSIASALLNFVKIGTVALAGLRTRQGAAYHLDGSRPLHETIALGFNWILRFACVLAETGLARDDFDRVH